MKYITTIGDHEFEIEILDDKQVSVDGVVYEVNFESVSGQPVYSLLLNGESHEALINRDENQWQVLLQGALFTAEVEDERERRLRAAAGGGVAESGEYALKAPMPGLVVKVPVKEGDAVAKGGVLVILESMKMQNELKAPREGTVSRVLVKAGDSVEQKQTMMHLS